MHVAGLSGTSQQYCPLSSQHMVMQIQNEGIEWTENNKPKTAALLLKAMPVFSEEFVRRNSSPATISGGIGNMTNSPGLLDFRAMDIKKNPKKRNSLFGATKKVANQKRFEKEMKERYGPGS